MLVFVNRFTVQGSVDEFERVFHDISASACGRPGFIRHVLIRSLSDPHTYMNIAEWEDGESLDRALKDAGFAQHIGRLRALARTDPHRFSVMFERTAESRSESA